MHGIFHVDGGIVFTLKKMFTEPGKSIREYLQGKRQAHFKPVLFVLIIAGFCSLLKHVILKDSNDDIKKEIAIDVGDEPSDVLSNVDKEGLISYLNYIADWMTEHFPFVILSLVPIAALGLYLGFKKYKVNYAEWLVYSCFSAGQLLAIYFVILVFQSVFGISIYWIYVLICLAISIWTVFQFFEFKSPKILFFRFLLAVIYYCFFSGFIILLLTFFIAALGLWYYQK
ncbi:DUF3667 domain-containing protein [Elizabethkingia sp. JS20170427COW]|uniref:DUF3667 domain-containing protein n=1 Tax=Elizabethkingia sp. JS20170427COW TaxID=2583851 RepID=UPI00143D094D|nr:DUF3667 domain-containing protein [Elizabethkingia sp. JS20170427COW]